jgi:two-component system, LuxR family, sensor kinase FixL
MLGLVLSIFVATSALADAVVPPVSGVVTPALLLAVPATTAPPIERAVNLGDRARTAKNSNTNPAGANNVLSEDDDLVTGSIDRDRSKRAAPPAALPWLPVLTAFVLMAFFLGASRQGAVVARAAATVAPAAAREWGRRAGRSVSCFVAPAVRRLAVSDVLGDFELRARELQESADRYRAIVDTAVDGIVVSDSTGTIRDFNRAAEKMFGISAEAAIGKTVGILMAPGEGEAHERHMRRYAMTGERRVVGISREVRGRRSDGTIFPLELSLAEWRDAKGERCFTGIMRDLTEHKRDRDALQLAKDQAEAAARTEAELSHKLREAIDELKVANDGLHRFTSIVAHDLRAPLKRVEAFVGILREDDGVELADERHEILNRLERSTRRMRLMLDSLLTYSKYNGHSLRGKTAELSHVIGGAIETFETQLTDVELNVASIGPCHVRGDALLLEHVMQNLIGNSLKFKGERPSKIDIAVRQDDGEVQISVADNGIGIDPQFADKVFEIFFRLHNDEDFEGVGIGLAVCRKIIHDHGGRIWVDKGYREGTRIVMTLPSADVAPRAEECSSASGPCAATLLEQEAQWAAGAFQL